MGWYRFTIIVPIIRDDGGFGGYSERDPFTDATQAAHDAVRDRLIELWDGFSRTHGFGFYRMDDQTVAADEWYRYEVLASSYGFSEDMTLRSIAKRVAQLLDQESVLYTVEPLTQGTVVGFVRQDDDPNID